MINIVISVPDFKEKSGKNRKVWGTHPAMIKTQLSKEKKKRRGMLTKRNISAAAREK